MRSRVAGMRPSLWLDGAVAGLAVGAIGTAVVYQALMTNSSEAPASALVTNLAYAVGDVTMAGLVVACLAVTGWRPGRGFVLLGAGFASLAVADIIYINQLASGVYTMGPWPDLFWAGAWP